jgi:hypothetical protein
MQLHVDREAVPDAPAVYFVRPNEANIKRICEDCAKQVPYNNMVISVISIIPPFWLQLYRTIHINFVTRVDRILMEKLAQDLVQANAVSLVSKIYDQYLDVIALEPFLFTLNIKNSFIAYNDPALNEQQIRY